MNNVEIWQEMPAIDNAILGMTNDLKFLFIKRGISNPLLIGIHTGGMWVAERLHKTLAIEAPLGALDIAFYRDDFTKIGLHPLVRPSQLPVAVDDRHIILVDDVLHTGRTIRAALSAIFDYGRPASVLLAVLATRNGRELPIEADVVGLHSKISPTQHLTLEGPEPLRLVLGQSRHSVTNTNINTNININDININTDKKNQEHIHDGG